MPKTYLIGNWKMNQSKNTVHEFFSGLRPSTLSNNVGYWVAPQFIHIPYAVNLSDGNLIKVGAQNCSEHESGAYTGEVNAYSLKEAECKFVIVGHSERRQFYGDTDEIVNKKIKQAQANNLTVVLCVGETLEQREAGKTNEVVLGQLKNSLNGISINNVEEMIIAYEPVWAIGTGKTATPEQAEEVHAAIRNALQDFNSELAADMSILYGGSVKPSNIKELMAMPNVNGGLVGGASLSADDFKQLVAGVSE
jgi:triosephosphate isomerase